MQYDSDYEVRLATLGAMGGNTGVTYDSVYEIDLEILRLTEQGGGGGGTGTSIDDTVTSTTKTWSSSKINNELAGKQGALTAGDNITIADGVISATGGGADIDDSTTSLTETWSSSKISGELADKANKADYIIGMVMPPEGEVPVLNIAQLNSATTDGVYSIVVKSDLLVGTEEYVGFGEIAVIGVPEIGATLQAIRVTYNAEATKTVEITRISEDGVNWQEYNFTSAVIDDVQNPYATMPWSTYSASKIRELLAAKQDTLTAGTNITISNNVISAQQPDLSGYATKDELTGYATVESLTNGLAQKQNTLTAGDNINIVNNVISADNVIDDIQAGSATTYSSNKIIELTQGLGFDVEIVQALPQTGDAQTIYMLPKADSAATDVYDEYIYTNNAWEKIGNTQTDLSQYYTKSETDTLLNGKQTTLTAGTGIQIVDNVISATGGGGTELSAGTNISISDNKINALGYTWYGSGSYSNRSVFSFPNALYANHLQGFVFLGSDNKFNPTTTLGQAYGLGDVMVIGRSNTIGGANGNSQGQDRRIGGFIVGLGNNVGGRATTCIGIGNKALGTCQTAIGLCASCHGDQSSNINISNVSGHTILAVGAGSISGESTVTGETKNALEVMANGDIYVYGAGGYDGVNLSGSTLQQLLAGGGGGGQSLSAGTNISIQNDLINALGYSYDSTNNQFKVGSGTTASNANEAAFGVYNRSRQTTSSGNTRFSVGIGTSDATSDRANAVEVMDNGRVFVKGVGNYQGTGISGTKDLAESINEKVSSTSVVSIWSGTQAQYDALGSYSNDVLYLIK